MAWMTAFLPGPGGQTASKAVSRNEAVVPLFRTNANLVVVDVVVRDKGEPVLGLKQGDFRILENGKEQRITVFEAHTSTDTMQASAAPALPAQVYSDAPQYSVKSAANVLLMDSINTPMADQMYVRQRMIRDLKEIPVGTQIASFKLDAKLHMVSGFTTDKNTIAKLLNKGPGLSEGSPINDPHFDLAMNQLSNLGAAAGASSLAQQNMQMVTQQTATFQLRLGSEFTMDAFTQLARYLSTIPGRKNLIWYTATVPFQFQTGGVPTQSSMGATMDMADFSGQMQQMLQLLAVARVAVYPVDSRGLSGTTQNTPDWDHLRMDQIATVTGGKAYYNTHAVGEALPKAIENGANYYTLVYSPFDKNYNGSLRRNEVKLQDNPHYDLEYRRGFYADDPAKQDRLMTGRTSPMIDAMQHGSLELSQVNFDVRLLPGSDPAVKEETMTPGPAGDGH
jgi:VWFA-related protein